MVLNKGLTESKHSLCSCLGRSRRDWSPLISRHVRLSRAEETWASLWMRGAVIGLAEAKHTHTRQHLTCYSQSKPIHEGLPPSESVWLSISHPHLSSWFRFHASFGDVQREINKMLLPSVCWIMTDRSKNISISTEILVTDLAFTKKGIWQNIM